MSPHDRITDEVTGAPTIAADPSAVAQTVAATGELEPDGDTELPERLGRYRVLDLLGEGGMGVVFTAYDPELDRKVAIKLLRASASAAAQDRLIREAQAMAKLSHANVVPVFDVGQLRGRVFLAMDYVAGRDLRSWLAQDRSWREILDVFIAAGRGLAHAHAHDIIHRDFKPDNVIVSEHGGERRVQVLDFGLAKTVEGEAATLSDDPELDVVTVEDHPDERPPTRAGADPSGSRPSAALTREGAVLGTPAYMSPEQFRGAPTTAATDQFSFCVALYEALWGQRPFAGTTLKSLAFAVVSGKLEPPPSSAKVPSWLWPIIARGLAGDPKQRWPSMTALLSALAADPTERRRNLALGTIGAAAFVGVLAWGFTREVEVVEPPPRCQGAAAELAPVWSEPRKQTIRDRYLALEHSWAPNVAAEVGRLLDGWGARWIGGRTGACEATELRGEQSAELMDLRIACYDRKLRELAPVVELLAEADAALLGKGVELVSALPALEICDDADALRAAVPPPDDPEVAREVEAIREGLAAARSQARAGQPKPALAQIEALLPRAEATGYAPLIAEAQLRRATSLIETGELESGRAALEAASVAAIATRDDDLAGQALEQLSQQIGYTDGDYAGGLRWARLAQALLDRAAEPSARRRAELAEALGMVEFQAGHFEVAREQISAALALLAELDGPEHPSLANPINVLGAIHLRSGEYAQAGEMFERSLAITERAYGPTHPNVAFPLNNLALVHERLGRFDRAVESFRRVLTTLEASHGEAHPNVGLTRLNIGLLLVLAGRLDEAEPEITRAVEILEAAVGPEHQIIGRALTVRGDYEREAGQLEQALASYDRALAIREAALGEDHQDVALTCLGRGQALLALTRVDAAIVDLERAVRLLDDPDADPIDRGQARFALARALASAGQRERVPALLDAARADYGKGGARAKADLDELDAWAKQTG